MKIQQEHLTAIKESFGYTEREARFPLHGSDPFGLISRKHICGSSAATGQAALSSAHSSRGLSNRSMLKRASIRTTLCVYQLTYKPMCVRGHRAGVNIPP